jgi:hypothetical protein
MEGWCDRNTSAAPDPTSRAMRYSVGARKKKPMTDGSSLSENEWLSRRKWTSMTFVSVMKKATARSGQGMKIGADKAGSPRIAAT